MSVRFNVGDTVSVNGTNYYVNGMLVFSSKDGSVWPEYLLRNVLNGDERWLCTDENCMLWEVLRSKPDMTGYESVESGDETVTEAYGDVDSDPGDSAYYDDYYNRYSNSYISVERWDDETEYSKGVPVDPSQIQLIKAGDGVVPEKKKSKSKIWLIGLAVIASIFGFKYCGSSQQSSPAIEPGLSNNANYELKTYLTGSGKEHAQVYGSTAGNSVDSVTKEIIKYIEGNTTMVYENPIDSASVAIVTQKEYCVVYPDSISNQTLVHVCNKNWASENSQTPLYHATECTNEFLRSLHIYDVHGEDSLRKSSSSGSHYHHRHSSGFLSGFLLGRTMSNRYNDYSNSIRQTSVSSRRSSGGGYGGGGK